MKLLTAVARFATLLLLVIPVTAKPLALHPVSGKILKRETLKHVAGRNQFIAPAFADDIALSIKRKQ